MVDVIVDQDTPIYGQLARGYEAHGIPDAADRARGWA